MACDKHECTVSRAVVNTYRSPRWLWHALPTEAEKPAARLKSSRPDSSAGKSTSQHGVSSNKAPSYRWLGWRS